jgi:hypothetical protein
MPRRVKYDEIPFEKPEYHGKIFMYSSPGWEILFPIVDIIRILKKTSIISTRNGKGQSNIRTYGRQYYHCILHDDLVSKKDYLSILKTVKCAFIFNDNADPIVTNVLQVCKLLNIPTVCYSSIDSVYHFTYLTEKIVLKSPQEVVDKMYSLFELLDVKKMAELFPDFEILTPEESKSITPLDRCQHILKEAALTEKKRLAMNNVQIFDPHLARIKKMERDRVKIEYDDDIEKINKKIQQTSINVFSKKINKA